MTLLKEIQSAFPNAEVARIFFSSRNIVLEQQYGFTPQNTRFAEGGCSDEINEPEYRLLENYWGERFKFGGLAGYCHAGKTGLTAVSHHVPQIGGQKNLLLVAGPHIGFHEGQWGKVPRRSQPGVTACCGSLATVLQTGREAIRPKSDDRLDYQQHVVEQLMLPYLEKCHREGRQADIVEATKYLLQRIERDLLSLVKGLEKDFEGQIALITGMTINTEVGNFFSLSYFKVHSASAAGTG